MSTNIFIYISIALTHILYESHSILEISECISLDREISECTFRNVIKTNKLNYYPDSEWSISFQRILRLFGATSKTSRSRRISALLRAIRLWARSDIAFGGLCRCESRYKINFIAMVLRLILDQMLWSLKSWQMLTIRRV